MKKYLLSLFLFVLSASGANACAEALGPDFTAEAAYLVRVATIKTTMESKGLGPDNFYPALVDLAEEMFLTVDTHFPETGDRVSFELIQYYKELENSCETLTLNRLNYLVMQMAVAMNPGVSDVSGIFEGADKFIKKEKDYEFWRDSYEGALRKINSSIGEGASGPEAERFESPQNLRTTIFRPCDRGQWVFPLISETGLYGLKTYAEAFDQGISITGLPWNSASCKAHEGLIEEKQFIYFLFHDLLHLQSQAPSIAPKKNKAHLAAMAGVVKRVLTAIEPLSIQAKKEAYVDLFFLIHECLNNSKGGSRFFKAEDSLADVAQAMIEHSMAYVKLKMNPALDGKESYYRYYNDDLPHGEGRLKLGSQAFGVLDKGGLCVLGASSEGDNSLLWGVFDGTLKSQKLDGEKKFYIMLTEKVEGDGMNRTSSYGNDYFDSFEDQQKFVYSQVGILSMLGDKSYRENLKDFVPSKGHDILLERFEAFKQKFFPDQGAVGPA